jgi:hypothetical protein
LQHRVDWYTFTEVSEVRTASIVTRGNDYKLWSLLLGCSASQSPVTSYLLSPYVLLSTLFSYTSKDERGDLLADPHNILNRWKNYFCQLWNVHGAGGVRQTEMHTAEPFVPEPSSSEVEVATGVLKRYKSPGVEQIPAELIQAGGEILRS